MQWLIWVGCKPDAVNTWMSFTFGHQFYVAVLDVWWDVLLVQTADRAADEQVGNQACFDGLLKSKASSPMLETQPSVLDEKAK